jgi:hypothetical protein
MRSGVAHQRIDQQLKSLASELIRDEMVAAGTGGARRPNKVDHEEQ